MKHTNSNQFGQIMGVGVLLGVGAGALVKHLFSFEWGIVLGFLIGLLVSFLIVRFTGAKISTPMKFAPGKFRNLILMSIVYFIGMMLVYFLLKRGIASPWNLVLAAATMIPGTGFVIVFLDAILTLDEMQSRIMTHGITFAFFATFMVVLSLGILEMAGITPLPMIFLPLIMVLFMGIGKLVTMRRYDG